MVALVIGLTSEDCSVRKLRHARRRDACEPSKLLLTRPIYRDTPRSEAAQLRIMLGTSLSFLRRLRA
jgi:hypothetical protein